MDENLKIINGLMAKYRGTLVLPAFNVVRLVDMVIGDDDYYWVYEDTKGETRMDSCVGGFTPLKDRLTPEEYDQLVYMFDRNIAAYKEVTMWVEKAAKSISDHVMSDL